MSTIKPSEYIYHKVMDALQDAEEISGPDFREYINLMNRISKEVNTRKHNALAIQIENNVNGD